MVLNHYSISPIDLWDPNVYSSVTEYVSLMTPQMNEIGDDSMKIYSINREVLLLLTPFLLIHIYLRNRRRFLGVLLYINIERSPSSLHFFLFMKSSVSSLSWSPLRISQSKRRATFLIWDIYVNGYLSLLTLVQCVRTNTLQLWML